MNSVRCVQERYGPGYRPRAELTYTYRVNRSTYSGKDRVPGCGRDSRGLTQLKLMGVYSQAFYDPARPNVSTLSRERSLTLEIVVAVMLMGLSAFVTVLGGYVVPGQYRLACSGEESVWAPICLEAHELLSCPMAKPRQGCATGSYRTPRRRPSGWCSGNVARTPFRTSSRGAIPESAGLH